MRPADPARFATTHWSLVLTAVGSGTPGADEALAELCRSYWYPLFAYLRSRGHGAQDAEDLTQAFFTRLLEKQALQQADPARGRFRSFLLASIKNFAANQHDREVAQKRGGTTLRLSLDLALAERRFEREPSTNETPERIFDRQWAVTLLERVFMALKAEYGGEPRRAQFERLKVYLLGDGPQLPYATTGEDLGMSEGAVKVAVHRLRRRFRDLVRAEIANTVASPEEIDDELRHLWAAVGR